MSLLDAKCFAPALEEFIARHSAAVDADVVGYCLQRFYKGFVFQIDAAAAERQDDESYTRRRFKYSHLEPRPKHPATSRQYQRALTANFTVAASGARHVLWVRQPPAVRRSAEIVGVAAVQVQLRSRMDHSLFSDTVDIMYLNYHTAVVPATDFKPTRLSRDRLALPPGARAAAFADCLLHGCVDACGGDIPMPVDASHSYVAADLVTLSEEYKVVATATSVVGVPDMHYVFKPESYPDHTPPGLSDVEFTAKYGIARLAADNHAYYFRAGPRF